MPLLAKELRAGGDAAAVREGGAAAEPPRSSGSASPTRPCSARRSRARVPIVGVTEGESLPYVLDTNLVTVGPASGLPVAEIATRSRGSLGVRRLGLAARLPVLRGPVVDELIASAARARTR